MTPTDPASNHEGQPSAGRAALLGLCPACGAQTLFNGPVRFADRCRVCGLDFTSFNVGDGPAAFLTMIVGGLIVVLAIVVDFAVAPPLWLHALIWIPVTVGAVVGGLRLAKGWLLVAEHQRRAVEGVRVDGDDAA